MAKTSLNKKNRPPFFNDSTFKVNLIPPHLKFSSTNISKKNFPNHNKISKTSLRIFYQAFILFPICIFCVDCQTLGASYLLLAIDELPEVGRA
jgi:hypothetical protein